MKLVSVAEKGKIGREVQRVEIGATVGQAIGRDAHHVEAEDGRASRQIGFYLRDQPLSIESDDEHRAPARIGQLGH